MVKLWGILVSLGLGVLGCATAYAAPNAAELAAANEAEKRGQEMFSYDQAAWHATDKFQADMAHSRITTEDLIARGFLGYIVEPGKDRLLQTTFFGAQNGRTFAIARYFTAGSQVENGGILAANADTGMSTVALRMIDARSKAVAAMAQPDHGLCSNSPANTLVLPPQADGVIPVYILTSTRDANIYPAGGHFRFDFNEQGKLIKERRFMKSCFPLDFKPKDGITPKVVFLTHLLDPQPTEIHVFVSLNIPIGIGVITVMNSEIWSVIRGRVRYAQHVPKQ